MFVTFEEVYLRDLYEKGKADNKKPRYQPDAVSYKHLRAHET